jgi:NAD(P)-dependent dehydrogenase (short-subunit alcohol dehydrogenase family)
MLCRNLPAARSLCAEIRTQVPEAALEAIECDLASLESVRSAASAASQRCSYIDLLINNAGMVSARHQMSIDGFELTFATNHLGPFLLTELLRNRLSPSARIVNVASRIHYRGALELQQITNPRARYRGVAAYAQSKLANVLHTFALARRLKDSGITVNCLHPGVVTTNLLPAWLRLVKPLISPGMFDSVRGAQTTLHLALSPTLAGVSGQYFDENQQIRAAAPLALNVAVQERLWEQSVLWTSNDVVATLPAALAR